MLIIYGTLDLGGIETFLVRFAKARYNANLKTKVLLLSKREDNNLVLLDEIVKYADIYLLSDIIKLPNLILKIIPHHLILLLPIRKKQASQILNEIKYAHVANSFSGLFFLRLLSFHNKNIPLTMGVYHALEYTWRDNSIPSFEKANRKLFFNSLPRENIFFFNERLVKTYEDYAKTNFELSNLFPLGVLDEEQGSKSLNTGQELNVISVGRLVAFKAYNLWMLDIIAQLKAANYRVNYVIYGDGPLMPEMRDKIDLLNIKDVVELRGPLDYSRFNEVVKDFDIFVGSGTALVQAAGLGLPCIVGIEGLDSAMTYEFFSSLPGYAYNEDNLYTKRPAIQLFYEYLQMNNEAKNSLGLAHAKKANLFSMSSCVKNFEKANPVNLDVRTQSNFNAFVFRFTYSINLFLVALKYKILRQSRYDAMRSK